MRIVSADEPGVNIKLNPVHADKQYYERIMSPQMQEIHIIKGRVVRVDIPSAQMWRNLDERVANFHPATNKVEPLLVQTDEPPTQMPTANVTNTFALSLGSNSNLSKDLLEAQVQEFSMRYGLTVSDAPVDEGETTELSGAKRRVRGQIDRSVLQGANAADTTTNTDA